MFELLFVVRIVGFSCHLTHKLFPWHTDKINLFLRPLFFLKSLTGKILLQAASYKHVRNKKYTTSFCTCFTFPILVCVFNAPFAIKSLKKQTSNKKTPAFYQKPAPLYNNTKLKIILLSISLFGKKNTGLYKIVLYTEHWKRCVKAEFTSLASVRFTLTS